MRGLSDVTLRFATDDDLLELYSKLDDGKGNGVWPRMDKTGKPIRTWEKYHQHGMNELARRLRSLKSTAEPFELGRLDARSKDRLREPAAHFALHFLLRDARNSADPNDTIAQDAVYHWTRGGDTLDAELLQLDYDVDNSGGTDEIEKNQPFPARFIRG